jgi:hypothetical protein
MQELVNTPNIFGDMMRCNLVEEYQHIFFYVSLTVHLSRTLSNAQHNAQFFLTLRLLMSYTGCPGRKEQNFGRVFLM